MKKQLAICSDHAGFRYKEKLIKYLGNKDYEVKDFGCYSEVSVDYPDFVHPLAEQVKNNEFQKGIILCGSGNGAIMVANKYKNVRAALCWSSVIAKLARTHNNANICCLPARFISYKQAENIVNIFLKTTFEGERHKRRVEKINSD